MGLKETAQGANVSGPDSRAATGSVKASRRGAIVVLRPGALDYRMYPSLAGGELLPYKSTAKLGTE